MNRRLQRAAPTSPSLLLAVAAVALLAALCVGCATVTPSRETVLYDRCGVQHAVEIETRVGVPAVDCVVLAAKTGNWLVALSGVVGFPALGCATTWTYPNEPLFKKVLIVLAPWTFDFVVQHERAHAFGMGHPAFAPWATHEQECPT
jgi:hypothetical protein